MIVKEWVAKCHELAFYKGWWDEKTTVPAKIALFHSELSEALEDYRNGNMTIDYEPPSENGTSKPIGYPIELADAIIRIFDFAGYHNIEIEDVMLPGNFPFHVPEQIAHVHYLISQLMVKYWKAMPYGVSLGVIYKCLVTMIEESQNSTEDTIAIKHKYNMTRPFRHGGKKC